MTIWPIILDSAPTCLRGRSLLLTPLGTDTLIGHLQSWLKSITPKPPILLAQAGTDAAYRRAIENICSAAQVVAGHEEFDDAIAGCELSDAFLIIDPRCLPVHESEFSAFVRHYSTEPRAAHQLVAFETGISGTKEHVSVDAKGRVRGVLRYYEPATWPFLAGVAATMLPVASGVLGAGLIPASLVELRQILAARGVPSRDVPITAGALDLSDEPGLLIASERFVLRATAARDENDSAAPLCVGEGQAIHPSVRVIGPVVIHADARVDESVTLVGPALIGAGAHIAAGAMVAHATIGPNCAVPQGMMVRDRLWFDNKEGGAAPLERRRSSYRDYLARLTLEPRPDNHVQPPRQRHTRAKRALDATAAALSLALLSPILFVVAIAVWLESRGPIFFAQKREGMGGRVFQCWKFRTMSVGADLAQKELKTLDTMDGPHFKLSHDPRVTRVGRVLRAANLDELPQLVNVLVGDMSLVGPRPSPFRENQVCVPWREARLSVRPGITGLWQVCRHDRSAGDFHQWIEYDVLYVRHTSFWLDLKILAATILTAGGKKPVSVTWLVPSEVLEAEPDADVFAYSDLAPHTEQAPAA